MLVREVIVLQVYRLYKLLRSNVGRRTKSDFSIVRLWGDEKLMEADTRQTHFVV